MEAADVQLPTEKRCTTCGLAYDADKLACEEDGTLLVEVSMRPLAGTAAGESYEILSVLGLGGSSIVYKARHTLLDRLVALKVLYLESSAPKSWQLQRFQQGARVASCLNHPNVVNLYDFGVTTDGKSYMVMEYVEGARLGDLANQEGYIPWDKAVGLFIQVCNAMEHAHLAGVVHMDLKPSNIAVVRSDTGKELVKVLDFGISELLPWANKETFQLSQSGATCGSPLYMSPEQIVSFEIDLRSDIYSLGATMYEMLSGRPPFRADNLGTLISLKLSEKPLPFKMIRPDVFVPPELEAIVSKAMSVDKNARHKSMSELKSELERVLSTGAPAVSSLDRPLKILIVDDNPVHRLALQADLCKVPDFNLVGEAENGKDAVYEVLESGPDIVLMDIEMPVLNGIEATRRIKKKFPEVRVLMFTMHDEEDEIIGAFGAGADAYCLKDQDGRRLGSIIRQVASGSSWLDPQIATRVLRACAHTAGSLVGRLSPEEVRDPEKSDKPDHQYLLALADTLQGRKQYDEAEALYRGAIAVLEQLKEPIDQDYAMALTLLADLYYQRGKSEQAEPLYLRALEIRQRVLHSQDALLPPTLRDTQESSELMSDAQKMYLWSLQNQDKIKDWDKLLTAETCSQLAWIYRAQRKYKEAFAMRQQAQTLEDP